MKRLFFAGVGVAVLLLGCQSKASTFTDAERAAVAAEIRAARDAYFDAATNFDAPALVAFMDEDFIHLSNSDIAPVQVEELAEAWKPLSHIEMDIHFDRVMALSRDSGYTIYTASYVVFDTTGVAVESSDWAGTHIWVRTDEVWKVQAVHEGRPTG
ncbi:MAG: DUF4440 domain-containing protein [Gemmatimonadota bacterium]|jgi:ketosteroid isomerase-like protein